MPYTFAVHEAETCRELIAPLWERSTGWGALTQEHWNHYVSNAPGGLTSVVTATSPSGEVIGAIFFVPLRVLVRGTPVRAHKPAAFIIDPSDRLGMITLNPRKHPIAGMYFFAVDHFRRAGDALFVFIPDGRWMRLLQALPGMQVTHFPLMSHGLPLTQPVPLMAGFSTRRMSKVEKEVEALGKAAASQYSCMVQRDVAAFEWRLERGDIVTAVERNGTLVGAFASRHKGDRQWLICDMVTADLGDALENTLLAALQVGDQQARVSVSGEAIRKLGILATQPMMPVLEKIGFSRDEYNFPLGVQKLDSALSSVDIAPRTWYATGDD